MKIYFCDICNQSIPLKDLDEGRAVAVKGKLLCSACGAAAVAGSKSGGATPASAPASSGARLSILPWLAGAAALAVAISWFLHAKPLDELRGSLSNSRDDFGRQTNEISRKSEKIGAELAALTSRLDDLSGELRRDREEESGRREHDQAELASRFAKVQSYVEENERLKEQVRQHDVKMAAAAETAGELRNALGEIRATLAELANRPLAAAPPKDPGATASGPTPDPSGLPPLPADLKKQVQRLRSTDPAERWEAVGELGRSANEKVVPYLIPLLKDSDDFVRHHTAEVLGDLDAKPALGPLIDQLSDEQLFVREMVYVQLRKISRVSTIKFEPGAKKEDRARQQKLWRTWLDENGEKKTAEKPAGS